MTNRQIWQIALQQSAYDCNCQPEDFLSDKHIITQSKKHPLARKYLPLPLECDLVSYGSNIVAQTSPRLASVVESYISHYWAAHCMETPNIHVLDDLLEPYGMKVCFMAEYFLPDVDAVKELDCPTIFVCSIPPILLTSTRPSGAMRFAKSEKSWTYWA